LTVQLRYADPKTGEVREIAQPFASDEFGHDFRTATPRLQLAVAVAAFAELLRNSDEAQGRSLTDVRTIAQRIAPQLADGMDVQEFVRLVMQAQANRGE
jgi:Ca-activated chloride channel homolog